MTAVALIFIAIILLQALLIVTLLWDGTYGCFRRELFDVVHPLLKVLGYCFVFLDIDHFGHVNEEYGYAGANSLVRESLRSFRRSRDLAMVCRYFSGDEFVIAVRGSDNAYVVARRLRDAFLRREMSVTVGISPASVQGAVALVQQAKPKSGPRPLEGQIIQNH